MNGIDVTIVVPSDATDFPALVEILRGMGMSIASIEVDYGQIKGRVSRMRLTEILKMDQVAFVHLHEKGRHG